MLGAMVGTPPYSWSLSSGSLPDGLMLSADGAIGGTPTTAQTRAFTVRVTDDAAASDTRSLSITINAVGPMITTTSLPDGEVGMPYSQMLEATEGTPPYGWSLSSGSLPDGLMLSADGMISGTPTTAQSRAFTVRVTDDASASATRSLSITIMNVPGGPRITTTRLSLPRGEMTVPYSAGLSATGGTLPYTWSLIAGALPVGLTLSVDGMISGTPRTRMGTFTVKVTDAAGLSDTRTLSVVLLATAVVATSVLPDGEAGIPYTAMLRAIHGAPPYTWSVFVGSLPDGLSLSTSGVISGNPTTAGTNTFAAQLIDSLGFQVSKAFTVEITIAAGGPPQITSTVPPLTLGDPFPQQLGVVGGQGPFTWSVGTGSLPPGLQLSSDGVISGTPADLGEYEFTIVATDGAGDRAEKDVHGRRSVGSITP